MRLVMDLRESGARFGAVDGERVGGEKTGTGTRLGEEDLGKALGRQVVRENSTSGGSDCGW